MQSIFMYFKCTHVASSVWINRFCFCHLNFIEVLLDIFSIFIIATLRMELLCAKWTRWTEGRVNFNSLKLRASDPAAVFVELGVKTHWVCHYQRQGYMPGHLHGLLDLVQIVVLLWWVSKFKGVEAVLHLTGFFSWTLYTSKNQYRIYNYCCSLFLTYVRRSRQELPSTQGWSLFQGQDLTYNP